MNTPVRLSLFAAGLAALFTGAYFVSGAIVPDSTVEAWNDEAAPEHAQEEGGHGAAPVRGLGIEQDGYVLSAVTAPAEVGVEGTLAFQISGAEGHVLTDYTVEHEQELHLIIVRTDGTGFRHVHPVRDAGGTWSLPWAWDAAGTYRVYTDFVPADTGEALDVTLTRTVEVAGDLTPRPAPEASLTNTVDGFDVALTGDLYAGADSELTVAVTKDGEPVTAIEPYLGAWGHLVALREGDLAYLHVHPEGAAPEPGETSGPEITFATQAPTAGRYLLYLDFQVGGEVRTAAFTVETAEAPADTDPEHTDDMGGH